EMSPQDWQNPWISSLGFTLGGDALPSVDERGERLVDDGLLFLMNAHHEPVTFRLPAGEGGGEWLLELDTADPAKARGTPCPGSYEVAPRPLALFRRPLDEKTLRAAAAAPTREARKQAERRRRRAGVLVPLFSIRSTSGWGLGEIGDLARFAAWAS